MTGAKTKTKSGLKNAAGKGIIFLVFFACIAVLIASWTGLVALNAFAVFVASAFLAFLAVRRVRGDVTIPWVLAGLCIGLLFLLVYPIALTHWVPASADAVTTTAMRVLNGRIPSTFAPYAGVSFGYQPGFPLISRMVFDLGFAGAFSDYLTSYLVSCLFAVLQLVLVFLIGRDLFSSHSAGWISAGIFFTSKLVFENQFVGEYGLLAAMTVILLFLWLWIQKNRLYLLCFPVILTLHPGIALNFIFLGLMLFAFVPDRRKEWIGIAASGLLALPALVITYFPILQNLSHGAGGSFSAIESLGALFNALLILPAWPGISLTVVFLLALLIGYRNLSRRPSAEDLPLFRLLLASVAFFILAGFLGQLGLLRAVELVAVFMIFCAASLLSGVPLIQRRLPIAVALILIIGLSGFYSSSLLTHYREGSKISSEEMLFAKEMRKLVPTPSPTLFLVKGSGKMAEIANQIPFDANNSWFLPNPLEMKANDAFRQMEEHHRLQKKIVSERCIDCIPFSELEFVVVDETVVPIQLPEEIVFSKGSLVLYRVSLKP